MTLDLRRSGLDLTERFRKPRAWARDWPYHNSLASMRQTRGSVAQAPIHHRLRHPVWISWTNSANTPGGSAGAGRRRSPLRRQLPPALRQRRQRLRDQALGGGLPALRGRRRRLLAVRRKKQIPVHARGAGSGVAGESLGPGIVVDFSRYLRRIVRTGSDTVRVQAGRRSRTVERPSAAARPTSSRPIRPPARSPPSAA